MFDGSIIHPKRLFVIGIAMALTGGAFTTTASAMKADEQPAAASDMSLAMAPKAMNKVSKKRTITKRGTVLDGARVRGRIVVKADDVKIINATVSDSITIEADNATIKNTTVKGSVSVKADNATIQDTTVHYGGRHSIRVYPGAEGTTISRTTVNCLSPRTNGIVFANYFAQGVRVNNCRNGFMSSTRKPAEVRNSWIDGKAFELRNGGPTPTVPTKPKPTVPTKPKPTVPTKPKPTVPTVPTNPKPTPPSSGGNSGERPDASNTGVPAGTSLRASGGMTITQDGAVVDGLKLQGSLTISADDVTIRNSLIQTNTPNYPIRVSGGARGVRIEDVEIDNMGGTGIGILYSGDSAIVRRVDIHSAEDGIRVQGDNLTVEDSYIHDMQRQPGGHHDTVQIRSGDNVTLRGNTLLPYVTATGDPMNAALQIGSLLGNNPISNLQVVDNYMNGGNFTINGGRAGDVDSAVYSGNRFGRDARYGVSGNLRNSTWSSSNVWDDTGVSVR